MFSGKAINSGIIAIFIFHNAVVCVTPYLLIAFFVMFVVYMFPPQITGLVIKSRSCNYKLKLNNSKYYKQKYAKK